MTPPLVTGPPGGCECGCALSRDWSYGWLVIDFAEMIGLPLDPWERLAAIHLGELMPEGWPRFRTVLIIVARQNGKTTLAKVLVLYWLFVECVGAVLNTSTDRTYAKQFWSQVCDMARTIPLLSEKLPPVPIRLSTGEEMLTTVDGCQFKFAANNGRAGRSMTLARWLCDELREHKHFEAWDAATNAQNAVPDAQTVCITNQGDDESVVLDSLRDSALSYIETGEGDSGLGLIEWSSPPKADPTDIHALAAANPNMDRHKDRGPFSRVLLGAAQTAKKAGGLKLAGFRTEVMCQRVRKLNPAIDPDRWRDCRDPGTLSGVRDRVVVMIDASQDGQHVTMTAGAVLPDGRTRIEPVGEWDSLESARRGLPALLARIKPAKLGWIPNGPAAPLAADFKIIDSDRQTDDPERPVLVPAGTEVEPIRAELPAVCMGLAEQVEAGRVAHSGDPVQDDHVLAVERLWRGKSVWVFTRAGEPCDAAYAAAGAVWLARTLPPPEKPYDPLKHIM